ncbi:MAG: hypothetical protein C5B59_02185 [Bacteroidetes bacterium]|nr:MAG: hypothetical protein C5B59_02185 [Bacteroidota bacterium]
MKYPNLWWLFRLPFRKVVSSDKTSRQLQKQSLVDLRYFNQHTIDYSFFGAVRYEMANIFFQTGSPGTFLYEFWQTSYTPRFPGRWSAYQYSNNATPVIGVSYTVL